MFERFTASARKAVVLAQEHARDLDSPVLGAEHLLLGVLDDTDAAPARVLRRFGIDRARVATVLPTDADLDHEALAALGVDLAEVRRRAEDAFGSGALDRRPRRRRRGSGPGHIPFTDGAKAALAQAVRAAAFHGDREVGSAQLFLGLLTDETVVLALGRCGTAPSTADLVALVRAELDQAA